MSDVENELDQLQRKLMIKTREIEALVAAEQDLGDLSSMESTQYARLRMHVEELIYKWQEAEVRPSTSNPDTAINRLIAELGGDRGANPHVRSAMTDRPAAS